jgi:hypothetical protein
MDHSEPVVRPSWEEMWDLARRRATAKHYFDAIMATLSAEGQQAVLLDCLLDYAPALFYELYEAVLKRREPGGADAGKTAVQP